MVVCRWWVEEKERVVGSSGVCSPVVLVYPIVPWDQRSPSLSETVGVGGLV